MRDRAFVKLVRHAYQTIPYYQQIMDDTGINLEDVSSIQDLERFPPLTKDDIRVAGPDLRSTMFVEEKVLNRRSSGTTGEPITSYIDPFAQALETYSFLRGFQWMGWKPGTRMVHLGQGSTGPPKHLSMYERLKLLAMTTR